MQISLENIFFPHEKIRDIQKALTLQMYNIVSNKHNLDFKATDFIGKKWMCLQNKAQELSSSEFSDFCSSLVKNDTCNYYLNFKDNVKKRLCLSDLKDVSHVEELISISKN